MAMSHTRALVFELKRRMREMDPLPPPPPVVRVSTPPARVFQVTHPYEEGGRATTALLGIGAVGARYATDVVLRFRPSSPSHGTVATKRPTTGRRTGCSRCDRASRATTVPAATRPRSKPDDGALPVATRQEGCRRAAVLADGLSAVAYGLGPRLVDGSRASARRAASPSAR
jgi:hypothetical protein